MVSKRSGAVVRKYQIKFEYKAENRPWRTLTDWVFAGTAKEAVERFKKGGPHIWPKKYRKIRAKRA